MCCGDNGRLRTCVFYSVVGSGTFCVLRSYKDENLLHVELFVCFYVFKCRWIGHSFRGNAAQFFSGFCIKLLCDFMISLNCYVNTLTVFLINE